MDNIYKMNALKNGLSYALSAIFTAAELVDIAACDSDDSSRHRLRLCGRDPSPGTSKVSVARPDRFYLYRFWDEHDLLLAYSLTLGKSETIWRFDD
ncbi:MAG: hypothetical protein H6963_11140 [Chromatiaceae bacterium]|nr:hypothetical protein [Chromatiaceae bacterium]MCP5443318.1 hypothetical protein [Chromatiaceae bacterium]